MTHFIRNSKNQTIISCDVGRDDLSSSINVVIYSHELLNRVIYEDPLSDFVEDFSKLDEIRGWWWEGERDSEKWKSINHFVETQYREVCKNYGYCYVRD